MGGSAAMSRTLEFSEPLTLRTVEEAHTRLLEALAEPGDLTIDCAAVAEVDLCGAQLLVSAAKTAAAENRGVRLTWPSSGALQRTLSRAGLVEAFERLLANAGGAEAAR
ncbi:MAG: STAS domain-containing protein [Phenylobacterium sp.]|jgi:anti-anti-sigma regulatory factor